MKKIFTLLLSIIVFLSVFMFPGSAGSYKNSDVVKTELQLRMYKEAVLLDTVSNILDLKDETEYGGIYFDENGNLVINALQSSKDQFQSFAKEAQKGISNKLENSNTSEQIQNYLSDAEIKVNVVKYSLAELKTSYDVLVEKMDELSIPSIKLYEDKNKVGITLFSDTKNKEDLEEKIGKLVARDMVLIEISPLELTFTAKVNVPAGTYLSNSSSTTGTGEYTVASGAFKVT